MRFKRGDISENHPGKLFLCYDNGRERWVTSERFQCAKIQSRKRISKWSNNRKMNWTPAVERKYKRGATSKHRPGLIFWGYWHYGMERWVTPINFEELRLKKNQDAKNWKPSESAKLRRNELAKLRVRTPEQKARASELQRSRQPIVRYREKRRAYKKLRRLTDPIFKLKAAIGTRIRGGFKRQCARKQSKTVDLLGCSYEEFKKWIASQFEQGMTFENYGFDTWHIDHIIPVGAFDLSDPIAAKHAYNFRNCRPAWGKPNLQKNDRIDMALIGKYNLFDWLCYTKDVPLAA